MFLHVTWFGFKLYEVSSVPVHSPEDATDQETPPGELDEGWNPGVGGPQVDGLHHLGDVEGGDVAEISGGELGAVSAAGGDGVLASR